MVEDYSTNMSENIFVKISKMMLFICTIVSQWKIKVVIATIVLKQQQQK